MCVTAKETVSRDFLPSVFFIIHLLLGPLLSYLHQFDFVKISATRGAKNVQTNDLFIICSDTVGYQFILLDCFTKCSIQNAGNLIVANCYQRDQ
jgi:hypothetical protein